MISNCFLKFGHLFFEVADSHVTGKIAQLLGKDYMFLSFSHGKRGQYADHHWSSRQWYPISWTVQIISPQTYQIIFHVLLVEYQNLCYGYEALVQSILADCAITFQE